LISIKSGLATFDVACQGGKNPPLGCLPGAPVSGRKIKNLGFVSGVAQHLNYLGYRL